MKDLEKLSNKEIFQLCQRYGKNAREWARKFAALLPEVQKRGLHRKYNFCSIYEFAAKLGGLSNKVVDEILRTYNIVDDKPKLRAEIEKQGWGKVRAVASIVTEENENEIVKMVQTLPKATIEQYVREVREASGGGVMSRNHGLNDKEISHPGGDFSVFSCKLDKETEFKLRKFKQNLEKQQKQSLTFNETIKALLDQITPPPRPEEKKPRSAKTPEHSTTKAQQKAKNTKPKITRYIPINKKREVYNNGKCSHPGCNKPHSEYHHMEGFAKVKNHDHLAPLCHEHHMLARAGLTVTAPP